MAQGARLTGEACRAARALLRWTTADLVREANVSPNTVNRIEAGEDVRDATAEKILATFDAHGVQILNGDAPGARLKPKR